MPKQVPAQIHIKLGEDESYTLVVKEDGPEVFTHFNDKVGSNVVQLSVYFNREIRYLLERWKEELLIAKDLDKKEQ